MTTDDVPAIESPAPPADLDEAGRALWESIASEYEMNPAEIKLLAEAARSADELAMLRSGLHAADALVPGSRNQPVVNPLFEEIRAHRTVLLRVLAALKLPADDDQEPESWASKQAREAAQERWRQHREVEQTARRRRGA